MAVSRVGTLFLLLCSCVPLLSNNSPDQPFRLLTHKADGRITIDQKGANQLKQLAAHDDLSIVAIIGPYRSGKSYLLNQFVDRSGQKQPFKVSGTTAPSTDGMYCYPYYQDSKGGGKELVVFLDTTGLFAPSGTENGDANMVALSMLLSSVLIYNHIGVMGAPELKRFEFAVKYAQSVPNESDIGDLREFQPDLFWVSRDFFLDIEKGLDMTKYVEKTMREAGVSTLAKMFRTIHGFNLPIPLDNSELLNSLGTQSSTSMTTPAFRSAVNNLRSTIFRTVRPKKLQGHPMSVTSMLDLLEVFVLNLNSDRGLQDMDAMKSLVLATNQKGLDKLMAKYTLVVDSGLPIHENKLTERHLTQSQRLLRELPTVLHGKGKDVEQFQYNTELLNIKMRREFERLKDRNKLKIQEKMDTIQDLYARTYREAALSLKLPQNETTLSADLDVITTVHIRKFKVALADYEDLGGPLSTTKTDGLKSRVAKIAKEIMRSNKQVSREVCDATLSGWKKHFVKDLLLYRVMQDFDDAVEMFWDEVNERCLGPSRAEMDEFFDYESYRAQVRETLVSLGDWYSQLVSWIIMCAVCACGASFYYLKTVDEKLVPVGLLVAVYVGYVRWDAFLRHQSFVFHVDAVTTQLTTSILSAAGMFYNYVLVHIFSIVRLAMHFVMTNFQWLFTFVTTVATTIFGVLYSIFGSVLSTAGRILAGLLSTGLLGGVITVVLLLGVVCCLIVAVSHIRNPPPLSPPRDLGGYALHTVRAPVRTKPLFTRHHSG